jgi:hypothetical protein
LPLACRIAPHVDFRGKGGYADLSPSPDDGESQ